VKRFYKQAAARAAADGHVVTLDDRPMKTPARRALVLPNAALARAVAEEWQAQGESVDQDALVLTRIACTALDRVEDRRAEVVGHMVSTGATDMTCYRVTEPAELVARQAAAWDPLLDWLADYCGARLEPTDAIRHREQSAEALEQLRQAAATPEVMVLSALAGVVAATNSLVIGLALREGRLDTAGAFEASQVEESYQIGRWGEDSELTERRVSIRREIASCAAFMALCRE
jgi:chaperone required for assembly of F1-ATPase